MHTHLDETSVIIVMAELVRIRDEASEFEVRQPDDGDEGKDVGGMGGLGSCPIEAAATGDARSPLSIPRRGSFILRPVADANSEIAMLLLNPFTWMSFNAASASLRISLLMASPHSTRVQSFV